MILKLQPDQISTFWDAIKFSMLMAVDVPANLRQDFSNRALINIMSGNAQCWLSYKERENGDKEAYAIFTTKLIESIEYGTRVLYVNTLYGIRKLDKELFDEGLEKMKEFAKANDCSVIALETKINRVREMVLGNGFSEHTTVYRLFI